MLAPRRTKLYDWIGCAAILVLGIWLIGQYWSIKLHGTTAETDLTLAEGVPTDVRESRSQTQGGFTTDYLYFTVAGYETSYSRDMPKYAEIRRAVKNGQELRAWVSTKQETAVPRSGPVPLYKVSIG